MGVARVTCASGCTCKPTWADGFWDSPTSLTQMHAFKVNNEIGKSVWGSHASLTQCTRSRWGEERELYLRVWNWLLVGNCSSLLLRLQFIDKKAGNRC